MKKPTRSAKQLHAMLLEEIESIPDLKGQTTDIHRGGVVWMDPEDGGPNWTVQTTGDRSVYRSDIARKIRQLQMQYDLEAWD